MHFVPFWWDLARGGLSWIFSREASALDLGDCVKPGGCLGALENARSQKLPALWWPFSVDSRTLGIPSILPWKTVYCLLGILDIAGIVCVCCFSKSKLHFLEAKWTCLFNCNSLSISILFPWLKILSGNWISSSFPSPYF